MSLKHALTLAALFLATPLTATPLHARQADRHADDAAPIDQAPCLEGPNVQQVTWFGERPSILEGVAISIRSHKIAWSNSHGQYPDECLEGETAIFTADVDYSSGAPVLVNKKDIIRDMGPECILEPQDFFNNDTELTLTCYSTHPTHHYGWVESVHLETGERIVLRDVPGEYNEIEGLFPDERYTLVESDLSPKSNGTISVVETEIYRMGMEPNSTVWERLTWFSSTWPWKAGNPVVSPDGRSMAVHSSRSDQPAGIGYGLYIVDLVEA